MKIIVSGGLDYKLTDHDRAKLDQLHAERPITELVTDGRGGACFHAAKWARSRGIKIKAMRPNRNSYGSAAADAVRNLAASDYADAVVAFAGEGGAAAMLDTARARGIEIFDWRRESAWFSAVGMARACGEECVEIPVVVVLAETRLALRVMLEDDARTQVWVPKSQVFKPSLFGQGWAGFLIVPAWFAGQDEALRRVAFSIPETMEDLFAPAGANETPTEGATHVE